MTDSKQYSVVVVGGGSAGCAAAVAAARGGARTLLVERYGFLGGTSTSVLDTFYGFFTPGDQAHMRQVVAGIGWEVVTGLRDRKAAINRPNTYGAGTGVTYNPEVLKTVWERLVETSGSDLLLHGLVIDVQSTGDAWQLEVATRTDRRFVEARYLIDASGDAQVATWAGAESAPVNATELQSLSTIFRLVNVDEEVALGVRHDQLVELMTEAERDGFQLTRLDGSIHRTTIPGSMVANMVRVPGINPLDPCALTHAEVIGRREALEYVRFLRERVPGYARADLVWLSTQIGVRESRRIIGDYTLTRHDVLSARHFRDGIALSGAPVEDHSGKTATKWAYLAPGEAADIPFSCLLPRSQSRLLVAGRCLSATHDAQAAVRSIAQCMAMGQAAGTAVALASREGIDVREVEPAVLREVLIGDGVLLQ